MPLEGEQFLAAGRVPHLRRAILTPGGQPRAVRRPGHGPDPVEVMPLEGEAARGRRPRPTPFAVLSSLPVASRVPSGDQDTE